MSNTPASDKSSKFSQLPQHGKTLIAALIGATIGSAACLHTYYSSLGGAEQSERISQIEATVEHNRQVGEETLAVLTRIEAEVSDRAIQSGNTLSKKPTQREITDAIDGLFEGLDEGGSADAQVAIKQLQELSQKKVATIGRIDAEDSEKVKADSGVTADK